MIDVGSASENGATPFVSIVIPTYNSGSLLDQTLSSCLKIQGPDVEIIVVDDHSTDGTPERVISNYPSIKLYRLPVNSGSGAAGRNLGISKANGRYIKFLDHDDLLLSRGFMAECRQALKTNADIIMSRWGVVPIDEVGRLNRSALKVFTPPEPSHLIESVLVGESLPFTSAVLYKRSFIQSELWDASAATIDDFDWFCRMAIRGGLASKVDTISYFWRLHSRSVQSQEKLAGTLFSKYMLIRYNVYKKIERQLAESGMLTLERKKLLAATYYKFTAFLAQSGTSQWRGLLASIYELNPDFVVDQACEPDPRVRRFVRIFGLSSYLSSYAFLKRVSQRSLTAGSILRRLAAQVPDRE